MSEQGKTPNPQNKQALNSNMPGDAIEVRESIEAKPSVDQEDVEMEDAGDTRKEEDAPMDDDIDADGEADADGEPDDDDPSASGQEPRSLIQLIDATQLFLSEFEEE